MTTSDRIAAMMWHLGYEIIETGGGCTAWFRHLYIDLERCHIFVTDVGGSSIPTGWDEQVLVGLYKDDGRVMMYLEFDSIVQIPDYHEWQGLYDDLQNELEGDEDENA